MPELPEVETVKRGLSQHCLNKKIISAKLHRQNLRYPLDSDLFDQLNNQTILRIERRGKHLLVYLDDYSLIIHLGMSGSLQLADKSTYKHKKHDHIVLQLESNILLFYNDPRRFGYWHITQNDPLNHACFINHGLEPLSAEFNTHYFNKAIQTRKQPIKSTIMDNKIVVGVGNIYACESLFLAEINPLRPSNTLILAEQKILLDSIKKILIKAIEQGGTTLKDYKNTDGKPGYFAQQLAVYGQAGKRCSRCQTTIVKKTLAQRSTFYCPTCQK